MLLFSTRILAGEVVFLEKPKELTYSLFFNNGIPEKHRKEYLRILSYALQFVASGHIENIQLINKTGPIQNYDFLIEITDSRHIETEIESLQGRGAYFSKLSDAFTMILEDHPTGPFIVRLFWDRLMFEHNGGTHKERADAFVRLVSALGHEIYGNVNNFKKMMTNNSPSMLTLTAPQSSKKYIEVQADLEIKAFSAGVHFLQNLITKFEKHIPEKTLNDLVAAHQREKEALHTWVQLLNKKNNVLSLMNTKISRCGTVFER